MTTKMQILKNAHNIKSPAFQREAMNVLNIGKELIIDELFNIINCPNPPYTDDHDNFPEFTDAIYLLARLGEVRAFPLIVQYFSHLGKHYLREDADVRGLDEDLPFILASLCLSEPDLLKQLSEDISVEMFVRISASHALVILHNSSLVSREDLIIHFKMLFDDELQQNKSNFHWQYLISLCCNIYPGELYNTIIDCCERNSVVSMEPCIKAEDLVDCTCQEYVDRFMLMGKNKVLKELKNNSIYRPIKKYTFNLKWGFRLEPSSSEGSKVIPSVRDIDIAL
jgi:hypothetical protein